MAVDPAEVSALVTEILKHYQEPIPDMVTALSMLYAHTETELGASFNDAVMSAVVCGYILRGMVEREEVAV